jgi:hypothetical protein
LDVGKALEPTAPADTPPLAFVAPLAPNMLLCWAKASLTEPAKAKQPTTATRLRDKILKCMGSSL